MRRCCWSTVPAPISTFVSTSCSTSCICLRTFLMKKKKEAVDAEEGGGVSSTLAAAEDKERMEAPRTDQRRWIAENDDSHRRRIITPPQSVGSVSSSPSKESTGVSESTRPGGIAEKSTSANRGAFSLDKKRSSPETSSSASTSSSAKHQQQQLLRCRPHATRNERRKKIEPKYEDETLRRMISVLRGPDRPFFLPDTQDEILDADFPYEVDSFPLGSVSTGIKFPYWQPPPFNASFVKDDGKIRFATDAVVLMRARVGILNGEIVLKHCNKHRWSMALGPVTQRELTDHLPFTEAGTMQTYMVNQCLWASRPDLHPFSFKTGGFTGGVAMREKLNRKPIGGWCKGIDQVGSEEQRATMPVDELLSKGHPLVSVVTHVEQKDLPPDQLDPNAEAVLDEFVERCKVVTRDTKFRFPHGCHSMCVLSDYESAAEVASFLPPDLVYQGFELQWRRCQRLVYLETADVDADGRTPATVGRSYELRCSRVDVAHQVDSKLQKRNASNVIGGAAVGGNAAAFPSSPPTSRTVKKKRPLKMSEIARALRRIAEYHNRR